MGYRSLGWFWAGVVIVLAGGGGVLQWLGPPARPSAATPVAGQPAPGHPAGHPPAAAPSAGPAPGGVAAPDPALLDDKPGPGGTPLPRTAADGRRPMRAYAAPAPATDGRPRVALVLADLGLSDEASREAIGTLPGPVTLAVSAYAPIQPALLDLARAKGHELLATVPMESQGYPLNDAGTLSLLTGAEPEANARNLLTALSRFTGYAGATAATSGLLGDRFAGFGSGFAAVASELSGRGLLYIDPRPGAELPPGLAGRAVDIVVDASPTRAEIEARLAELERVARAKGSALGLASPIRPVTLERLASWARGLDAKGIALVPASALVAMPAAPARPNAAPAPEAGHGAPTKPEHP